MLASSCRCMFFEQIKQALNRAWLRAHENDDWNKIDLCDKPHIPPLFMCNCDFIWSKILFPWGKCEHFQWEQDQACRKSTQEHKDKAFSKAAMNGWLKSPLQATQCTCVQFKTVHRGKEKKKIPSPKSWGKKKSKPSILHITKSEFGKLITISLQRPIRNKPLSLRHKFEFQSLQLTQLINEFLNADCARRPSTAKPLGRSH